MSEKPAIVLVHGFWGGAAHWAKVITELHRRGFHDLHAVENPLTSLADDAERTRKMVRQIDGPVVLVGHSYGGAVITEAGDLPNVSALVYVAAFAPDAGESPGAITEQHPPAAFANIAPDSDGYLWLKQDKFHESFAQDLTADEALVMAVTPQDDRAGQLARLPGLPAGPRLRPDRGRRERDRRLVGRLRRGADGTRPAPRTRHLGSVSAQAARRTVHVRRRTGPARAWSAR